jgi:aspartate 1-decarboxylase
MFVRLLKSKLHLATVTRAELHYHGSVTIAADLMDAVGLIPYEQVLIGNCSTGQRGETYVLRGESGSGQIQMNGAMARLATPGDRLIIMSFAEMTPDEVPGHHPRIAILDEQNRIVEKWEA